MVEFKEWPKIPRGGKGEIITITEKIDGTNACVIVEEVVDVDGTILGNTIAGVQSRARLISVGDDNYGFAAWVSDNANELAVKLGPGYHYGEWAGEGIQKNPHNLEKKTFFLFNSDRWRDGRQERPAGVECVPVLYEGTVIQDWEGLGNANMIDITMDTLWRTAKDKGYHPEGIVIWYHKTRRYEKVTFENANGKWAA